MIFRAWDEPNGFTDVDAGITIADTRAEVLSVTVWQEGNGTMTGGKWFWEIWTDEVTGWDHSTDSPVVESFALDGGTADTQGAAEKAADASKRELIRTGW